MKSILSKSFVYVPAAATDVRKTIRREQKRLALAAKLREEAESKAAEKVAKRAIGAKP